jgi:serine/threonine protein phosphatase PrpC
VFELDFAARVDRGLVRESTHDVARVVPRLGLALVADGGGGHAYGDFPGRVAADGIEQSLARFSGFSVNIDETAQRLERALFELNPRIADHPARGEGQAKTGITLVAAVFTHGWAAIGNVSECRCYCLRSGSLELLTQVAADIRVVRCEPGDVFLLCSDGLGGSVSGDVMATILGAAKDASEACERLIGAAWAAGGLDNIGIAIVRLVPLQP